MTSPGLPRSTPHTRGSCLTALAIAAACWLILLTGAAWLWRAITDA